MISLLKKPLFLFSALIGLFLVHFGVAVYYAVDVPYWDEWDNLPARALSWKTLWRQHNEHRIVLTKIQTWILYRLTGWNLQIHVAMNFVIFGALVYLLYVLLKKIAPNLPLWARVFSTAALLTVTPWQNHSWGFQSQFHFFLLFGVAAILVFLSSGSVLSALGLLFLSCISFSAGLVFSAVIAATWILFETVRGERRPAAGMAIGFSVIAGIWLRGYETQVSPWPRIFPWNAEFWRFFSGLVSLGYGILGTSPWLGVLGIMVAGATLVLAVRAFRRDPRNPRWPAILSLLLGTLACLAVIASGRAATGIGNSKTSRYAEIAMLLIPATFATLAEFSAGTRRLVPFFAGILFIANAGAWAFAGWYSRPYRDRTAGLECLKKFYAGGNPSGICPTLYPGPAGDRFLKAKELGLHFTRKF